MEIINVKPSNDLSGLYIVYYGSCNLEKSGIKGLSHLMEHLICKSLDHLQDELDNQGISWNAATGKNEITFYFTGLEENLSKFKNDFLDLLLNFKITEKEFSDEKSIVIEEYLDVFNNQTESHFLNLLRREFNHYDAIGCLEDLESLTYKDCQDFFKLQFSKPCKIINVSPEEMKEESKNKLKDFSQFDYAKYNFDIKKNPEAKMEKLNDFNGKRSILVFSNPITNQKHIAPVQFITYMLSSGLNSPLYKKIREEQGLCYYLQNFVDRLGKTGINFIASQTSDKNIEKFKKSLYEVLEEPNKYLTQERFDLIKNKLKIGYKKKNINLHSNVDKYIEPKEWVLENYIDSITLKDCLDIYNLYFSPENLTFTTDKDY